MKKLILILAGVFLLPSVALGADAKISSVKGSAEIKAVKSDTWYSVQTGLGVKTGQAIKTKARSRVKVELSDGSKIEINPNSTVNLDNLSPKTPSFKLAVGRLKAWITRNHDRTKFEIRTPVAVCSVRGTEFTVDVAPDGKTEVEVMEGLLGVRKIDGTGEEVPVGAGQRLDITADRPITRDQRSEAGSEANIVRREVSLDMSKEQVQAAAAAEMRLAEYQEGKTMVDVSGLRVRLEEYIVRPAADTFKLVVLNDRDSRFDYFYYQGKFNKSLPTDLSLALNDMSGKLGAAAPEYYLTEYEQVYSNTSDFVKDTGSGGHLVKIVYNSDGTITLSDPSDVANTRIVNAVDAANGAYNPITDTFDPAQTAAIDLSIYNPATDAFEAFVAGQTMWKTRFNSYEHYINSLTDKKIWYLRSDAAKNNLAADLDGHWIYKDAAGNYGEWGIASSASTYPDGQYLHNRIKIDYVDDTYEQYDNYIIDDEGKLAKLSDFSGITTGAAYKLELLKWNYETVITATELGSRKIDLVVEPKIFIKSGIIK